MRYQLNTTNYCDFAVYEQNKLPGPLPDTSAITWDGVAARLLAL